MQDICYQIPRPELSCTYQCSPWSKIPFCHFNVQLNTTTTFQFWVYFPPSEQLSIVCNIYLILSINEVNDMYVSHTGEHELCYSTFFAAGEFFFTTFENRSYLVQWLKLPILNIVLPTELKNCYIFLLTELKY